MLPLADASTISFVFEDVAMPLVQAIFFTGTLTGLMFGLQFGLAIAYGRLRGLAWNELTAIYFFLPLGICLATAAAFVCRLGYLAVTQAPILKPILENDEWSMETFSILGRVFQPIALISLLVFALSFAIAHSLRRRAFYP